MKETLEERGEYMREEIEKHEGKSHSVHSRIKEGLFAEKKNIICFLSYHIFIVN